MNFPYTLTLIDDRLNFLRKKIRYCIVNGLADLKKITENHIEDLERAKEKLNDLTTESLNGLKRK